MHDCWAAERLAAGWTYDPIFNDQQKQHPLLKQYALFNDREKDVYRNNIREAIKAVQVWGWKIDRKGGTNRSLQEGLIIL